MSAVPAWKRLGLKLKGAQADGSPVSSVAQITNTASAPHAVVFARQRHQSDLGERNHHGTPGFNKRKQFPSNPSSAFDNKRPRRDDVDFTPSRKSVSFSEDTKKAAPKKPKPKKKKAPKQQMPKQPSDLTPSLEYLRTWHKARDSWKFNKNHQTLLVKYLYHSDAIPSADIDAFYLYIRDIKGASRKRLVEQAEEIRQKDMADGPKGFPEGTKGAEEKQEQYRAMLADLLQKKDEAKEDGKAASGAAKRSFDEVEFVLRTVDKDVQQRVVKRMRAEMVIEALESSDSGENTEASTTSTVNTSTSRVKIPSAKGDAEDAKGGKASKQKTKRRKKLRTADTDSSSSSSDSDFDLDSDSGSGSVGPAAVDRASSRKSSSSSSSSDSGLDMAMADGLDNAESSSSSSSSSDSDGLQAGAGVPGDEDTSGSDGDSESSDSSDSSDSDDD